MASRNDLVPTVLVDKNGVITTRWTRAEPSGESTTSIPGVSAPASPEEPMKSREELRQEEMEKMPFVAVTDQEVWDSLNPKRSLEETIDRYLDLPDVTRDNIIRSLNREDISSSILGVIMVKMLAGNKTSVQMIDDVATYLAETNVRNIIFTERMFDIESEAEVQYQPIQIDITGLRYYRLRDFNYDSSRPIREQDGRTREQVTALFKLHSFAYQQPTVEPVVDITADNVIKPYWLAQYAAERPEMTDHVISLIVERRTADETVIRNVLGNESPTMMRGVL